jgi:hypothetical protein
LRSHTQPFDADQQPQRAGPHACEQPFETVHRVDTHLHEQRCKHHEEKVGVSFDALAAVEHQAVPLNQVAGVPQADERVVENGVVVAQQMHHAHADRHDDQRGEHAGPPCRHRKGLLGSVYMIVSVVNSHSHRLGVTAVRQGEDQDMAAPARYPQNDAASVAPSPESI